MHYFFAELIELGINNFSRYEIPAWVLIWVTRSPMILVVLSFACFSAGLVLFVYSSGQVSSYLYVPGVTITIQSNPSTKLLPHLLRSFLVVASVFLSFLLAQSSLSVGIWTTKANVIFLWKPKQLWRPGFCQLSIFCVTSFGELVASWQ